MPTITQHIPGFFDGVVPEVSQYNSLEELLAIPWIKTWKQNFKDHPNEGFLQFSKEQLEEIDSEDGKTLITKITGYSLLAEFNQGKKWYVIGNTEDDHEFITQLPDWEPNNKP